MNFSGTIRINRFGVGILIFVIFLICLYTYKGNEDEDSLVIQKLKNRNRDLVSLKQILSATIDLTQGGGDEVVNVRKGNIGEQTKGNTKEGAKDRVTEGDFRSHQVMYYGIKKAFPKIKVISEEHTESTTGDVHMPQLQNPEVSSVITNDESYNANDVTVWIDPLDATQEYTENLLSYVTTMICVAVKGIPIIGVIHKPFSKETFWGVVGHGISSSLQKLQNTKKNTHKFRILVSRSHAGKVQNYTEHVLGKDVEFEIKQAGGAGYKVLDVISGESDVYLHVTVIKKWDLCAGNALLNSVGGVMTTISDEDLKYDFNTNPVNTKGILAYLKSSTYINQLKNIKIHS